MGLTALIKVRKNPSNGQMIVTIPRNAGIEEGDLICITRVDVLNKNIIED